MFRNEDALQRFSVPRSDLANETEGKTVAVVGNARSLEAADHGAAIDTADIVVRINSAPIPSERSHGGRTDWLAVSTPVSAATLQARQPSRHLWMTPKRRRLPYAFAAADGFYLFPQEEHRRLSSEAGERPTTGLMVIDLLSRLPAARIDLYGFDFFASLSLSGARTSDQVPHDFNAERDWVHRLLARDGRFTLVRAG
ncbi:glycosyltransferase family 29 protein [Loktanella sp. IMCC34160]|uniref:glycosyltransferase family 29 protein n=1 Tax=Loktanella sp. IMCC34160 TaxID=2510646 RepID=UPI0032420AE6